MWDCVAFVRTQLIPVAVANGFGCYALSKPTACTRQHDGRRNAQALYEQCSHIAGNAGPVSAPHIGALHAVRVTLASKGRPPGKHSSCQAGMTGQGGEGQ